MSVDILKLKALAQAAKQDQYDYVALNDYGMAMPPAVTLELIAEIERHRQVNAEGCKPEISILPVGIPCASAAVEHGLDKAEGGTPDNSILPVVTIEGDLLVISITTECLLHAVTCSSQWPIDEEGSPIRIINRPLMVEEIINELQREDEQGTNAMHRMFDEAALAALDNGSEAVSYDDEAHR